MSYKITYGVSRFDKPVRKKTPIILGLVMICAFLSVPLFREGIRDFLIPRQQWQSVSSAYETFEDVLEQGSGVADAITAFCAQIVENAGFPYE